MNDIYQKSSVKIQSECLTSVKVNLFRSVQCVLILHIVDVPANVYLHHLDFGLLFHVFIFISAQIVNWFAPKKKTHIEILLQYKSVLREKCDRHFNLLPKNCD